MDVDVGLLLLLFLAGVSLQFFPTTGERIELDVRFSVVFIIVCGLVGGNTESVPFVVVVIEKCTNNGKRLYKALFPYS